MKILIAGGNGFIGSSLRSFYGDRLSIITIDYHRNESVQNSYPLDLTSIDQVATFVREQGKFDVLIFLVGLAHAKGKGKDLPDFIKINFQTLANLLDIFELNGKIPGKIIFASTISVFGESYKQQYYYENDSTDPISPYARTKLQAEEFLLNKYADNSWILRFAPVYSPEFTLNLDRRTQIRGLFYKIGKGNNKLSLCNINNIMASIDGIIKCSIPPGVYNISDPSEYTYNDLLKQQGARFTVRIPAILVLFLYAIGSITNNIFLKENSTKLVTDNIYPSKKISAFVKLTPMIKKNS
jgi:nucleoside-diphosphate-sugar epimerase